MIQASNSMRSMLTITQSSNGKVDKYYGLIEQKWSKIIQNRLYQLFSYLDSIVPNLFPMHDIISFFRIFQFIGPCLAIGYNSIWKPDSIESQTLSIISILFHLLPAKNRSEATIYMNFIYIFIHIVFFISLYFSSYIYRKKAKLPKYFAPIISVYVFTFGYLIHPIIFNINGEMIGQLINQKSMKFQISVEIVSLILVILCFLVWIVFWVTIAIVAFTFRPNSLMTVISSPQIYFVMATIIITTLTGIASQLSKYPSFILTFISAVFYGFTTYLAFSPGNFVKLIIKRIIFTISISSAIISVVFSIYILIGRSSSFAEILIYAGLNIILFFVSHIIFQNRIRRQLISLDCFQEGSITIEAFKTPGKAINTGITGMAYAHPSCINWSFMYGIKEKWPHNSLVWTVFGKFVAIYQNQTNLLYYIIHSMEVNKLNSSSVKQSIAQAKMICMQRESALSNELKYKLSHLSKQVSITKSKIRRIWDLVIQGNINEMESAINTAYESVNKSRSSYMHILSQYPNNRFVARSYNRFVLEIEGNPILYSEWSEKVKLLQRGILVSQDRANFLGIHAFPGLPEMIVDPSSMNHLVESESNLEIIDIDEKQNNMSEQMNIIRERIDHLSFPAIKCIKIWSIFLLLCLYYLPCIGMMFYAPSFLNDMSIPLNYMYQLSILRSMTFQLPVFSYLYVLEKLNFVQKVDFPIAPSSYNYETDTENQTRFLLTLTTRAVEEIGQYRSFKPTNTHIAPVTELVFGSSIKYTFYVTDNSPRIIEESLQSALVDFNLQISKLLTSDINISIFNSPVLLNSFMNYDNISSQISEALRNISIYLEGASSDLTNLILFFAMFICIVYVLLVVGILIFELDNLKKNKILVYKSLTSLPKNIVSSVSESLRVLKKDKDQDDDLNQNEDSEVNKQEDNILKVFASASDATNVKSAERSILIILNLIILACIVASTILLCQMFPTAENKLRDYGPHLDYVLGSAAYMYGIYGSLLNMICIENNCGVAPGYNLSDPKIRDRLIDEQASITLTRIDQFTNYFHQARYGNGSSSDPPYPAFQRAIDSSNKRINCSDSDFTKIKNDLHSIMMCFTTDRHINLLGPLISSLVEPFKRRIRSVLLPNNQLLQELWMVTVIFLYDSLFYPMFDQIVPDMERIISDTLPLPIGILVVLLVFSLGIVIFIIYEANKSQTKMKFALSMLHQCPSIAVMQSSKIMDLLSGDFTPKVKDTTQRNDDFFDMIVQRLPDAVIATNSQGTIELTNKAVSRILGVDENIIGTNIETVFSDKSFVENIYPMPLDQEVQVELKHPEKGSCYLNITCSLNNQNYIYYIRDQTQTVCYNTLIAEERAKSDSLLSSILPPSLVKRVQNGEKNISFAVQSATILFLDIVEFTPWCASNTAAMVMSTLNKLYREFDVFLSGKCTMTKIKCIGDCYMAAGGIFVEINQPSIHAKEVVEFGLEAISFIGDFNKSTDQSLRIRVGVNTGGPIVAGVLGTEKPTFEILGPPINMAQQMEHNGIPMMVHISRATYELIYGGSFNVKERGQIEIKNGKVITYLVSPKTTK
ncbi:Adenylate and Guanylate cyclase catalytic domain containing protein [Tritrichomonas foetus]|uniref:Adenylate and Guanylate cyclase catalytic domain containing protein n=1 Tax=Tritrichomonas foetus TaxID=1144522 RepID=A0A1J4JXP7_9EUKA|nr:Adenylate and Guanylate cyclase catalytic domain containing protein [Tritrichomonas foetus]|eukprot:OHT03458.1 Adenylate and Guanylate cyclase catalytic domain containing protein [Tritrichomonas foetus]